MSKKSWAISYGKLWYNMGHDFLDRQYLWLWRWIRFYINIRAVSYIYIIDTELYRKYATSWNCHFMHKVCIEVNSKLFLYLLTWLNRSAIEMILVPESKSLRHNTNEFVFKRRRGDYPILQNNGIKMASFLSYLWSNPHNF